MSYHTHTYKPLRWFSDGIHTPPFSPKARVRAGVLLRMIQGGAHFSLPLSRPMPVIGPHCHELRIPDGNISWRIVYSIEKEVILILAVFRKTARTTPQVIINACRKRLEENQK